MICLPHGPWKDLAKGVLLFALLCVAAWSQVRCTPSAPAEYPRQDCRVGAEATYYSDGTWSATGRTECGKAW